MLFTEPMKKIELLVMKNDLDSVMRYLGFSGSLQLIAESHEQRELSREERETAELRLKVQSVAHFLGVEPDGLTPSSAAGGDAAAPDRGRLHARAQALMDSTRELLEEEGRLLQRKLSLERTVEELSVFSHLNVDFQKLHGMSHLTFRAASVAPEKLADLEKRLEKRALVLRLNRPGYIMAVAPKKGRCALDTELKRAESQDVQLPDGMKGIPADLMTAAREDLRGVKEGLGSLEKRKEEMRAARREDISFLLEQLDLDFAIDAVKQGFASTGSVQKITGWLPSRRCPAVAAGLESLTQGRMALKTFDPEELPEVKKGTAKVPVSTPHGRLVRSFERMVLSYSVPLYGSIDPTPFVAVIFVVLFAIMFGDVGQGFVGLLLGVLINSGKIKAFAAYKKKSFGTVFILAGSASMVAGLLYGSFFANEELLVPVSLLIS
ncbi:MAG: V-type ATPase 116kDa subunit family protein [Spirochaetia bacterium]